MRNKIQIAFDLGSHSVKSAVGRILPDNKIGNDTYPPKPKIISIFSFFKKKIYLKVV